MCSALLSRDESNRDLGFRASSSETGLARCRDAGERIRPVPKVGGDGGGCVGVVVSVGALILRHGFGLSDGFVSRGGPAGEPWGKAM